MKVKKLSKVLVMLLALVMLVGMVPFSALAAESTYYFLNPLGRVEPRLDTPLAERSGVTDILYATGTRTLRLGVTWYTKPLDGEPPIALGQMLKAKWEAQSADPAYTQIPAGLTVQLLVGAADGIPSGLYPWNNKADAVYDTWAANADALIVGVGD